MDKEKITKQAEELFNFILELINKNNLEIGFFKDKDKRDKIIEELKFLLIASNKEIYEENKNKLSKIFPINEQMQNQLKEENDELKSLRDNNETIPENIFHRMSEEFYNSNYKSMYLNLYKIMSILFFSEYQYTNIAFQNTSS